MLGALRTWWRRWRSSPGGRGEQLAAEHLAGLGYRILQRNYRNRFGEIDLLALAPDGRTVVVVEVKTSEHLDPRHPPELRVNLPKQRRLVTLACAAARQHRLTDRPIRFDVVAVILDAQPRPEIKHIPNAFEAQV